MLVQLSPLMIAAAIREASNPVQNRWKSLAIQATSWEITSGMPDDLRFWTGLLKGRSSVDTPYGCRAARAARRDHQRAALGRHTIETSLVIFLLAPLMSWDPWAVLGVSGVSQRHQRRF